MQERTETTQGRCEEVSAAVAARTPRLLPPLELCDGNAWLGRAIEDDEGAYPADTA